MIVMHRNWNGPAGIALQLSPRAWHVLESSIGPKTLPNLLRVSYGQTQVTHRYYSIDPIHVLVGHQLRCLHFVSYGNVLDPHTPTMLEDPNLLALLAHLPRRWPKLQRLMLLMMPPPLYAKDALADSICGLRNLVLMKVENIPLLPRALYHLACLPNLQYMDIHCSRGDYTQGLAIPHDSAPFPSLQTVTIFTNALEWCTALLAVIHSPDLYELTIHVLDDTTVEDFTALSTVLSVCPSREALRTLIVGVDTASPVSYHPKALPPSAICPLFALRAMKRIHIIGRWYAALDNDTIAQLARAWPELQHAQFCTDSESVWAYESSVTLAGLAPLARCLHLCSFEIALADVGEEAINKAKAHNFHSRMTRTRLRGPRQHALQWFNLDVLPATDCPLMCLGIGRAKLAVHDILSVAAILSGWFPSLQSVHYRWVDTPQRRLDGADSSVVGAWLNEEMSQRWGSITPVLSAFVKVRVQERRWRFQHYIST